MDHSLQNIRPFPSLPSLMEVNSFPIRLGRSEILMGSERQEVLEAAAEMGVRETRTETSLRDTFPLKLVYRLKKLKEAVALM